MSCGGAESSRLIAAARLGARTNSSPFVTRLLPLNGRAGETATELGVINRADPTTARASARRRRATNTGTSSSSTYARPSAPPPAAQSRQRKPHQSSACEELRASTGNISRSCSLRSSSSSSGSVQWRTQRQDPR